MAKNIYLDVCALCRLFDDQSYMRIRLETLAVNLILSSIESGNYKMIYSPVHFKEIYAIQNDIELFELHMLLQRIGHRAGIDMGKGREKAEKFVKMGFGIADAAHVAFAELSSSDFISCDYRLLKKCKRAGLSIWTGNPIAFCDKEELQ